MVSIAQGVHSATKDTALSWPDLLLSSDIDYAPSLAFQMKRLVSPLAFAWGGLCDENASTWNESLW
jgi:hypothetical protein